jgi:hypothetical protein
MIRALKLIDPEVAPRAAEYLLGLPNGLDSYPECQVRSELTREIFKRFPQIPTHPALAPELRERLRDLGRDEWMSDVVGVVARIMVRDVVVPTDEELDRWSFEVAGEIFAKPVYRMLMYVLSPTLVLMGATKRWSAFRRGSTLTSRFDGHSATAELRFPRNLYNPLVLRGFGHAFRASLTAARASDPKVELVETSPEIGRWTVSWR